MIINFNKIQKTISTRLGFVLTLLILYWLKNLLAYTVDFNLDIQVGKLQGNYLAFIAFFNPLPLGLLLLALALYARSTKAFYSLSIAIYSLLLIWLFSNVFYYREFSDFITANHEGGQQGVCWYCGTRVTASLGFYLFYGFPITGFPSL